jgi:hypothetical protein
MKLNKIFSLALGLAMLPMLSGCDDNDLVEQTPLASPTGTTYTATYNTIECSWNRVEGATNYGYEFTDADGNVIVRDVTLTPSLTFTGLSYSTVYYLNVWAYAPYGTADGTSATVSCEMRTADLIAVDTPTITLKKNSSTRYQFSWTASDNAKDYTYTFTRPDGTVSSNTTSRTSVTFTIDTSLVGTYTFTLVANVSDDAANSGYKSSDVATSTFEIEAATAPVP